MSYETFSERYQTGQVPWDHELPPPEVIDLLETLPTGRALDLGCGYGRSGIYLAQKGWQSDGVDFVPEAIGEANRRATEAGVATQVQFHVGSVAEMGFLENGRYNFAIDIGCMHSLNDAQLIAYRDELLRLLAPNAIYILFVHLHNEQPTDEEKPRGIAEATIQTLFSPRFTLTKVEHGETQIENKPVWRSAWFWWQRQS